MKSKSSSHLLTHFLFAFVIVFLVPFLFLSFRQFKLFLGLTKIPVPVVGTGSMYPSLFWAKSEGGPEDPQSSNLYPFRTEPLMYRYVPYLELFHHRFYLRQLNRGDIVSFHNQKTAQILANEQHDAQAGFIKRIIALPGDKILLKDGYVYLNGHQLVEPYIYKPRSTYGGSFLPDCQEITIPPHKLFVMGDNRKISLDSRSDLGLIDFKDVVFVLPYDEQELYHEFWRDPSHDADLANQPTLNVDQFYQLLNQLRHQSKLNPLKPNSSLEYSARLRANQTFKSHQSLSFSQAIQKAGYHNPLTGEFIIRGYYDAQELISSLSYSPSFKKQLLDARYQDIGVAVVNDEINHCPTQVIVGHLGGYVPANYDQTTLQSWSQLLKNLNEIIPSWEKARDYSEVDQAKLDRLLQILYQRRQLAQDIVQTMQAKRWLTPQQETAINQDQQLAQEAEQLIKELNGVNQ